MKIHVLTALAAGVASLAYGYGKPPEICPPGSVVLFQGDSLTDGYHLKDMNHVYGHSYVWEIATRYQALAPERRLEFANRGKGGNTSADLVRRWPTDAFPYTINESGYEGAFGRKKGDKVIPDCVSILIGINDYAFYRWKHKLAVTCEEYEANLRKLIADAKEANPSVRLVLCEPFRLPTDASPEFSRRQDVVAKLAAENDCAFVSFQKCFSEDLLKIDPNWRYWFWDFYHATPAGHYWMADYWIRCVAAHYARKARNTALEPRAQLADVGYDWFKRHETAVNTQTNGAPEIVLLGDETASAAKVAETGRTLDLGSAGDRIQNVLWRLSHGEMDGLKPRVVVVSAGRHNRTAAPAAPANTEAEIAAGLDEIVRRVREKAPGAKIVLAGCAHAAPAAGRSDGAPIAIHSAVTNGVTVRWFEEMVPMRDGTKLYTFGALPPPGEKAAVVLVRHPYVSAVPEDMPKRGYIELPALKRGYACIYQHVRGCGMSEGAHRVYVDERNDGLDTLAWIRKLPHYNGSIFLSGGSYLSSVHWSYLDTNPPDVKGCHLAIQDVNRYNINYRNGNFKIALQGNWTVGEHKKNDRTLKRDPSVKFTDLPLRGFSERRLGEYVAELEEAWDHPRPNDPWWRTPGVAGGEYRRALIDSTMPVMMETGFYDIYTEGLFDMWREISPARRANCALVVDDGSHNGRRPGVDQSFDWFDWCQDKGKLKRVIPGETVWFGKWESDWRHAPLLTDAPEKKTYALDFPNGKFTYDPSDPPRFNVIGCHTFGGVRRQPETGWRKDVVTCELPPLERAVSVRGRMRLVLRVRSDCEDTTFYVRISAQKLDGAWYNVRDDIKTLLWDRETYRPGDAVEIAYDLSDHAFRLEKGERLRVEVAGASADQFVPHTNQKGPFHLQTKSVVARNEVLGGTLAVPLERQ